MSFPMHDFFILEPSFEASWPFVCLVISKFPGAIWVYKPKLHHLVFLVQIGFANPNCTSTFPLPPLKVYGRPVGITYTLLPCSVILGVR